jgi:hypothetical protein
VPGQAITRFPGKVERFVGGDSWFHDRCDLVERRSLHDGQVFSQGAEIDRAGC